MLYLTKVRIILGRSPDLSGALERPGTSESSDFVYGVCPLFIQISFIPDRYKVWSDHVPRYMQHT